MKTLLAIVAAALLAGPAMAYQDSDQAYLDKYGDTVVTPTTVDEPVLYDGRDDDSDPVVTTVRSNTQCEPTYVVETVTEIVEVEKPVYIEVTEYVEVEKVVYLPYEPESRAVYDSVSKKVYVYDTEVFEGPIETGMFIPYARFDLDPETGTWTIGELELPEGFNDQ